MMRTRCAIVRVAAGAAVAMLAVIMLYCALPQRAQAEAQGGALMAGGAVSTQAQGDLRLVSLSGAGVSGNAQTGYTVFVRDGDKVEFTLNVQNSSSSPVEYISMVDGSTYEDAQGNEAEHFSFPGASYRAENTLESLNSAATNATWEAGYAFVTSYDAYVFSGYTVAANTQASVAMSLDASTLPVGEHDLSFTLGRRHEIYSYVLYSDGARWWEPTGQAYTADEYLTVPVKVEVYAQEGAALSVGTGAPANPTPVSATEPFDLGELSLDGGGSSGTVTFHVANARQGSATADGHGNPTSINTRLELGADALDTTPFGLSGGQEFAQKDLAAGGGASGNMSFDVAYDTSSYIAGTYTGNLVVTTVPRSVSVNGGDANATGIYTFPIKITLTGENKNLDAPATNLATQAGNGLVQLSWTPAPTAGSGTYYVYRRVGVETSTDPNTWTDAEWSKYTQVGSVAVDNRETLAFSDGTAVNGTTYSYTVVTGGPYRGYAAAPVSETPSVSGAAKILAPMNGWDDYAGTTEQEGGVYVYWNMNQAYGGKSCDGADIVDHFNVYRDGVLVRQVYQSAVGRTGEGTQGDPYEYDWGTLVPVPEPYVKYTWSVSAVSANGVEGHLSGNSEYGENTAGGYTLEKPVIVGYEADFYSGEGLSLWIDHYVGPNRYGATLSFWRAQGTSAPSTSGAPMKTVQSAMNTWSTRDPDFTDTGIAANKAYTYTVRATDADGNASEDYTFTVYSANGRSYSTDVDWSVANGTTPTLQFYVPDEGAVARVYRNNTLVNRPYVTDDWGRSVFTDTPSADGTYTYRVDFYYATGNVTTTGRTYTFVRDSHAVASMLKPPDAPVLSGRISGQDVVLSWTSAATGGEADGFYVYRKDDGAFVNGRYNYYQQTGQYGNWYETTWGNNRYLIIKNASVRSLVDTRSDSCFNGVDGTDGWLAGISWTRWDSDTDEDRPVQHEWYIRAYNEAGVSEPSQVVSLAALGVDEYNSPILPVNEDAVIPGAPVVDRVWVDWEDNSSAGSWDSIIGGTVRVAWSDPNPGGGIDAWNIGIKGSAYHQDDVVNSTLYYAEALRDSAAKRGGRDFDGSSVTASPQSDSGGDYGRTVQVVVTAQNSMGASAAGEGSVVVRSLPRFYALPGNGKAVLRWSDLFKDTTTTVTGWEIWRKAEYGVWERAREFSVPLEHAGTEQDYSHHDVDYYEWTDSGLDNGWTYEYKVVAKCGDGNDRPSVVREVTPAWAASTEAPGKPQGLTHEIVNGEIQFHWNAPTSGGDAQNYHLCTVHQYSDDSHPWLYGVKEVQAPSTSATWAPREAGTYRCFVYATSRIGDSDRPCGKEPSEIDHDGWTAWSVDDYTAHLDELYPSCSDYIDVTISSADISQRATGDAGGFTLSATPGENQVQLSWTASSGATYYKVERYLKDTGYRDLDFPIVTLSVATRSYTDATAVPGVKYVYRVTASNDSSSTNGSYAEASAVATGTTHDQMAAARVVALIEALPAADEVNALDGEAADFEETIEGYYEQATAVKEVFDSLTTKQKSYVEAAAVERLESTLTAIVARKYEALTGPVQALVEALPGEEELVAASEEELDTFATQIAEARAAYNALPEEAKPGVDASKLTAAERALADARKVIADKKAAKAVDELIAAIPGVDALALSDGDGVRAAREAYAALTVAQQQYVSKLSALEAAEARIAALQRVEDVKQAIRALKPADELDLSDLDVVSAAHDAYEALPQEDKPLVGNELADKLQRCWDAIQGLVAADPDAAAKRVDDLIDAIGEVAPDKAGAVADARSAYEALSDAAKDLVTKLSVLEAAEQALADFEAAADIDGLISALPASPTLDDADRVAAAREAYDAASPSVRAKVTRLSVLEAAEGRIAELREAARVDISEPFGALTLSATSFTYSGADHCPGTAVLVDGKKLVPGRDYDVFYANNRNAGTATVTVMGIGNYKGVLTGAFDIAKAANPLSAKAKAKTLKAKYKKLKKKSQKLAALAVSGARGKVAYRIVRISAKKRLAKQARKKVKLAAGGELALKKKLKKGAYAVTVRVSAAGDGNYLPATKDVTVKLRVK